MLQEKQSLQTNVITLADWNEAQKMCSIPIWQTDRNLQVQKLQVFPLLNKVIMH